VGVGVARRTAGWVDGGVRGSAVREEFSSAAGGATLTAAGDVFGRVVGCLP